MDLELNIQKTQAGLYTVTFARMQAPMDIQEAAFTANGLETVSPAKFGFLRATQPEGTTIFNPYSRTDADVVYDNRDNGQVVVLPGGVISKIVGTANLVESHRQGKEYVIPENQRELVYAVIDECKRNGIAVVANYGQTNVNTSEFGQIELTHKLFSEAGLEIKEQDYGDWLVSQGMQVQSFYFDGKDYAKSQKGPYLNRLRVYSPGDGFFVVGDNRYLSDDYDAFGVCFQKTAEGGAQK